MKVVFIYKFIPIFIFYTDILVKDWAIGRSLGFFIVIRPGYRFNPYLETHELIHCKQFFRTFGLHWWKYNTDNEYKLRAEIEAFTTEFTHRYKIIDTSGLWIEDSPFSSMPSSVEVKILVARLFENYKLDMSKKEIRTEVIIALRKTFPEWKNF